MDIQSMPGLVENVFDKKRGCGWRQPGGLYLKCEPMSFTHCPRTVIELSVCPVCSSGIKPSRSWTWINPVQLVAAKMKERPFEVPCARCKEFPGRERIPNAKEDDEHQFVICALCRGVGKMDQLPMCGQSSCFGCPLGGASSPRAGLVWVGDKHYSRDEFMQELREQGASRRIPAVPKDFRPGETWVFAAHRKAFTRRCEQLLTGLPHGEDCPECEGAGEVDVPAIFTAFQPDRVEYVVKGNETREELEAIRDRGIVPVQVTKVNDEGVVIT